MNTTYRFAPVLVRVLALCSAISWAVTPCKAQGVITIPTGPFCGDCVITNLTFYDVSQLDAWRIDLSQSIVIIRKDVRGVRNQISYAEGVAEHIIQRVDSMLAEYDSFFGVDPEYNNVPVPFDRLDLENLGHNAATIIIDLTGAEDWLDDVDHDLDLFDNLLLDDLPEYRATFAAMCEQSPSMGGGGACTNCCNCPDYTPYFVSITNRLADISLDVRYVEGYVRYFYQEYFNLSYLFGDYGWTIPDIIYADLVARLRQTGSNDDFRWMWESFVGDGAVERWTYPVTSYAVMSNLMASTHLYPSGVQTSLATYGATYAQTPTYGTLEGMPMLDRITVLLKTLVDSVHTNADAVAVANATAESHMAQEELDDDVMDQQAITEDFESPDVDVDVGISALWTSLRGLLDAFAVDLPRQVIVYEGGDWVPGMTIQTREWDDVFSFCRFLARAVWVFVLIGLAGRLARFYAVLAMSFARLAYGVAQGSVDEWRNAWSGFVETWGRLLSGAGGD